MKKVITMWKRKLVREYFWAYSLEKGALVEKLGVKLKGKKKKKKIR